MATVGICVHCHGAFDESDSLVCGTCLDIAFQPFEAVDGEAAKSSTCTLEATVCQGCGHKMDGRSGATSGSFGPDGKACTCHCHE